MQADVHGIYAMLVRRAGDGADAGAIASAAIAVWRDIDRALAPIIGQPGVAALYKRSLYLALVDHPCLVTAYEGALRPGEFVGLDVALSQQLPAQAMVVIVALLNTFHELLTQLIGGALFERLLRSVWDEQACGNSAAKGRK